MTSAAEPAGVVQLPCKRSVAATINRLQELLNQRQVLVFAHIDFSGDAERAGLAMRPEQMLIFGNPKGGTPLMQAVPLAGLDLPMKVLVWEAPDGAVWAAYNDPTYLQRRYGLSASLVANLAALIPLIKSAVGDPA
jgi:uncharacterized protein (DUF302 family)